MVQFGVIAHGGAGSSEELTGGVKMAVETGFKILESGKDAIDAAMEAVRVLEDDGRYNAGSGSLFRMDGKTIEMDAAIMTSAGSLGAVLAIRNVKNPVLVARAVCETPHVVLAGPGAGTFARRGGFRSFHGTSRKSRRDFREVVQMAKEDKPERTSSVPNKVGIGKSSSDTVGAVALDMKGVFAVAVSTGGFSPMMVGRVGDTPLIGCGFYAGTFGGVAVTGLGEEIIRRMLAGHVYNRIETGMDVEAACTNGIHLFPDDVPVGIIALTRQGFSVCSNRGMAHYELLKEV
ncbi:MAG: N(4)-(Beta-N-acetylglucosaminyl)-L-asparaginase precursor [Syntrophorhabdus sp. PtaU1.Bin002]|nr:MAG: N(4)-(Beta-N-acetylglucosaminyl)-L-asparaginase precursor [Syntrophorhabdus sp. PtaU1.Bin002]